jgi:hypothetical protein
MNWAFKTVKQFHLKTESSDYSIISGLNFVFQKQVPCCFTLTSIDKVQDTRPKIGYGITADINNTRSDFQLPSSNSKLWRASAQSISPSKRKKSKTGVKTRQCCGSRKTKKKESRAYQEHLQVQF